MPPGGDPVLASWDRPFFYISNPNAYPSTYGPVDQDNIVAGWSVDYASSNPSFIVGIADWWGTEESGYSTNGGQTWTKFANRDPRRPARRHRRHDRRQHAAKHHLGAVDSNQPYYTLNGGTTWSPITLPGVTSWSNFDCAYYLDTGRSPPTACWPIRSISILPGQRRFYEPPTAGRAGRRSIHGRSGLTTAGIRQSCLSPAKPATFSSPADRRAARLTPRRR